MNRLLLRKHYSVGQWYMALARLEQLLSGGLPLALALNVVAQQCESVALKHHFEYLQQRVQAGVSLSQAIAQQAPKTLSTAQAGIAVAEQTGQLTSVMRSLVGSWQRQRHIRAQIKEAIRYPLALLSMGIIIIAIFIIWVLPTIQQLFHDQPLPLLTQYLVNTVTWVTTYAPRLVIIQGGLCLAVGLLYWTHKRRVQALMQHLPIWGKLHQLSVYQSTFEYLALGLRSGMSAVNATRMVARHSRWLPMQRTLDQIACDLNEGIGWSEAFARAQFTDPTIQAYLHTAEQIGRIDNAVERLSEDFQQRIEAYCEHLRTWLNPLLMAMLTGIIGFMLLAMYLPIFSLTQQLA